MTPRVEWGALVPPEVRAAAEPMLTRWLPVVPTWVHTLAVHWDEAPDDNGAGTTATMESRIGYREGVLTICAGWLSESAAKRDDLLRHELAHLATAGMCDVFDRLLRQFKKENPALRDDFEEQWRQALEGATCDIAAAYGAVAP